MERSRVKDHPLWNYSRLCTNWKPRQQTPCSSSSSVLCLLMLGISLHAPHTEQIAELLGRNNGSTVRLAQALEIGIRAIGGTQQGAGVAVARRDWRRLRLQRLQQ